MKRGWNQGKGMGGSKYLDLLKEGAKEAIYDHTTQEAPKEDSTQDDLWGEDLPEDVVEQCISFASQSLSKHQATPGKSVVESGLAEFNRRLAEATDDLLVIPLSFPTKAPYKETFRKSSTSDFSQVRSATSSQDLPPVGTQQLATKIQQPLILPQKQTLRNPSLDSSKALSAAQATTEWLRTQLEKTSSECKNLRKEIQCKLGESQILRGKLQVAEKELERQRQEKHKEVESIKQSLESKIKELERQLERTQVQMLFKTKEAESNLERYRELKTMNVKESEPSTSFADVTFERFMSKGNRPGESLKEEEARKVEELQLEEEVKEVLLVEEGDMFVDDTDCEDTVIIDEDDMPNLETAQSEKEGREEGDGSREEWNQEEPEIDYDEQLLEERAFIVRLMTSGDMGLTLSRQVSLPDLFINAQPESPLIVPPKMDYDPSAILIKDFSELFYNVYSEDPERNINIWDEEPGYSENSVIQQYAKPTRKEVVLRDYESKSELVERILSKECKEVTDELTRLNEASAAQKSELNKGSSVETENCNLVEEDKLTKCDGPCFKRRPFSLSMSGEYKPTNQYCKNLEDIHSTLLQLTNIKFWDRTTQPLLQKVVDHVTVMGRELYKYLCDPRHLVMTSTALNNKEIIFHRPRKKYDHDNLLSHIRMSKSEKYVEFRRGLALLAALTNISNTIGRLILNSKEGFYSGNIFDDEGELIFGLNIDLNKPKRKTNAEIIIDEEKTHLIGEINKGDEVRRGEGNVGMEDEKKVVNEKGVMEEMSEGIKEIKQLEDIIKAVDKYWAIGKERVKREAQMAKDEEDFYMNYGLTSEDLLPIKAGQKESKKRIQEKRRRWKEHLLKAVPQIKDYLLLSEDENEEVSASSEEEDKNSQELVILETTEDNVAEDVKNHKKQLQRMFPELPEVGLYSDISALNFDTTNNIWEKVNNRVVDKNYVITAEDYNSSEYYCCINEVARPEEQAWTSTYLKNLNNIQGHVKKISNAIDHEFPEHIEQLVLDFDYCLDADPEEDNVHLSDNEVAQPEPDKDDDPFARFADENTNTSSGQTQKRTRELCDSDDDFQPRPVSFKESKMEKAVSSGGSSLKESKNPVEARQSSDQQKIISKEDEEAGEELRKKGKRGKRKMSEKEGNQSEAKSKKGYATRASRMLALCEPSTSRETEGAVSPENSKPSTSRLIPEEPKHFKMPNPSGGMKKRLAPILSSKAFKTKKKLDSKYGNMEEEVEKELNMMYEENPKMKHSEEKEMEKELGESELPLELFPKSEDAVELFREYKRNCSTLGLLDILYEILCYTSSLRLSPYFDPLFMSIVELMRALFLNVIHVDNNIVVDFMMKMIREILYCWPSSRVLLGIQSFLCVALQSERAVQQLCHNPSTQMSLLEKSSLYFYKGTCILQVMCHQVKRLSCGVMERYWELCYALMSWVFKIYQFHVATLARMWYLQPPHVKLCKCVHLFHTMIFRILNRVAFHYNIETNFDMKESTKIEMEAIMLGGLELTKTLLEIDSRFALNLKREYLNFAGYIRLMRQMHESKISLEQDDVEWLERLLKEEQMKRVIDATEREEKLSESWAEDGEEGVTWAEWESERKKGEDFTESTLSDNLWAAVTKSELEGRSLPLDTLDDATEDPQLYSTQAEERIKSLEEEFGKLVLPNDKSSVEVI